MSGTNGGAGEVQARFHTVYLPTPRSVNNLYRSILIRGKTRETDRVQVIKSKRYVTWLAEAKAMLRPEDKGLYAGSRGLIWTPTMYVNVPWGHDLDNMAKGVFDLIAAHYGLQDGYHDEVHYYRVTGDHMLVQFVVQDTGLREGQDGTEELPAEPGVTPPAVPG